MSNTSKQFETPFLYLKIKNAESTKRLEIMQAYNMVAHGFLFGNYTFL